MHRFGTALAVVIALTAMAPAARAGSYVVSFGGHRFHVEAPRACRSASCIAISSQRSIRPAEQVAPAPAPPPPAASSPPACAPAPLPPPPHVTVAPPVLAAATSQPLAIPPMPGPDPLPPARPRSDPPQADAPAAAIAPAADVKPLAMIEQRRDEDAASPLGEWESVGAKGAVRIERCGPALCGYTLTDASRRGESVLINMTSTSAGVWTGHVYSRSSGNTYHGTMTLKSSGRLHVEACALGRFVCSGNDWRRVEEPGKVITTSRQWSARS